MIAEVALIAQLNKPVTLPMFPTREAIAISCEADPGCKRAKEVAAHEADLAATRERMKPIGTLGNTYSYGYCTWMAASMVEVPIWLGNANTWDSGLLAAGWRTGEPRVGAIAQTDAGYWGHVAVVTGVEGDNVLINEYNYTGGWNQLNQRWVHKSAFRYFYL